MNEHNDSGLIETYPRTEDLALLSIAAIIMLLHVLTNFRYGFHRDELQILSDARHLDWGFVAYPPLTPFLERVGLVVFGVSLEGLRLFSVVAQVMVIWITGLMTRELGGGQLAQVGAAIAVALSPVPLFEGTEFQYTSFEYLWCLLCAYFVVRLLKSEDSRWWFSIAAVVGLGLMTKYSVVFFVVGVLAGFLMTPARRFLVNWHFCGGITLVLLMIWPNFMWEMHHGFISFDFLRSIHVRDVGEDRANGFVRDQFLVCANIFAAPLWIAGLFFSMRSQRYRPIGWMYLVPFSLLLFAKGRGYYLAETYPMLMAMGAVAGEHWVASLPRLRRRIVQTLFFTGVTVCGLYICAITLPLASSGPLMRFALRNNADLREEFGWTDMVKTVASIRDSLPPPQQSNVGVLVGNYGEEGALEIFGPAYHLPPPISGTNSAWLRGYPKPAPPILIVLGVSNNRAERMFVGCQLAGQVTNIYGVENEESSRHSDIFLCTAPRLSWPDFWKQFQHFG